VLRTLAPLTPPSIATRRNPFDLHVLSTPPAFVLSQNQTLRKEFAPTPLKGEKNLTVHVPNFELLILRPVSPESGFVQSFCID
jgi:hypothetical protein